jgi:hypothetical protein
VCRIFYSVSVLQYMYNSRITTIFILWHVSTAVFGHHQVVLIQSLSTLYAISPPLANVYNWGRSNCCLLKEMLLATFLISFPKYVMPICLVVYYISVLCYLYLIYVLRGVLGTGSVVKCVLLCWFLCFLRSFSWDMCVRSPTCLNTPT